MARKSQHGDLQRVETTDANGINWVEYRYDPAATQPRGTVAREMSARKADQIGFFVAFLVLALVVVAST